MTITAIDPIDQAITDAVERLDLMEGQKVRITVSGRIPAITISGLLDVCFNETASGGQLRVESHDGTALSVIHIGEADLSNSHREDDRATLQLGGGEIEIEELPTFIKFS